MHTTHLQSYPPLLQLSLELAHLLWLTMSPGQRDCWVLSWFCAKSLSTLSVILTTNLFRFVVEVVDAVEMHYYPRSQMNFWKSFLSGCWSESDYDVIGTCALLLCNCPLHTAHSRSDGHWFRLVVEVVDAVEMPLLPLQSDQHLEMCNCPHSCSKGHWFRWYCERCATPPTSSSCKCTEWCVDVGFHIAAAT